MNIIRFIKAQIQFAKEDKARNEVLSNTNLTIKDSGDFSASLKNPTEYYKTVFHEFHKRIPQELRIHRAYYQKNKRGFGEEAFHVMWWNLFNQYKPKNFLEIGVYRGQVISLISLIAKLNHEPCDVTGISPFSSIGDSVSKYRSDLDYQKDTLLNFSHFGLKEPRLLKAYSTDEEAVHLISSEQWDMIYIDGNHDYDIVVKDWAVCSKAIKVGGIIVLDDSGLSTSYKPPLFAKGGHPGPSQLASEISAEYFEEILQVGHNRVFKRLR